MNAEEFYEELFKPSLRYLGVDWGQKHLVQVKVKDGHFIMSFDGKTTKIDLSPSSQALPRLRELASRQVGRPASSSTFGSFTRMGF